jgi:multiple sugar transport system substrate-binding protein
MAVRGALTDLTEYFETSDLQAEDFFPNHWDQWHYDGKLWGLAVTTSSNMYCYNAGLVREAGLDPDQPPTNIAELDAWAEALTVLDENGNFVRVGFRPTWLWLWGHVFGANFYDEANQKITANEPKLVETLEWMASYAQKWDIEKIEAFESGFGSYAGATNPFLIELQASVITGEWMIEYAKEFAPDLEPEIRYIPAPPPPGGVENVTTFGGSIFTTPNGVKNPDASWEFIRYIQDPQIGGSFARAIANLQPVQASLTDERFTADPRIKLGLDLQSGPHAYGVLPIPVQEMYEIELNSAQGFVLHGQKTSQEALDDVTALIQAELNLILGGGSGR